MNVHDPLFTALKRPTYQSQWMAEKNVSRRGFGELVGEVLHLGVDLAILGADLLCLLVNDICGSTISGYVL